MNAGRADICFLAIDPARETTVAFTAPYAVIEGVFAVANDSVLTSAADVDRAGIRIGVKQGSAYDLFLSRTLADAEVVRGGEGSAVFLDEQLDVAAGIRAPLTDFVASRPGLRLLEPRFMEIRQAVGTTRTRHEETVAFLRTFVEELKAGGFIAAALQRAGRSDATVAPPAGPDG
jgi:polar amino acid transport system substrate-binding protein